MSLLLLACRLQNERRVGRGVLRLILGDEFEITSVRDYGCELFELVECSGHFMCFLKN